MVSASMPMYIAKVLSVLILISLFSPPLFFLAIFCSVDEKLAFCCHWHPRAVQGKPSALHTGENAFSNAVDGAFIILDVLLQVSTRLNFTSRFPSVRQGLLLPYSAPSGS